MSQAKYVIQSSTHAERFLRFEKREGRNLERAVLLPFLDQAHEFESSFAATQFAVSNLAPDSYVVRTMVNGYLLPLGRKEGVKT